LWPKSGETLHIFDSAASSVADVGKLAEYCRELLPGLRVECHGDFTSFCLERIEDRDRAAVKQCAAEDIASARVMDPSREASPRVLPRQVIDYELRMLERLPPRPVGILYDGYNLCCACAKMMAPVEALEDGWAVIVTDQLFGTYEQGASRYHARVSVYGFPTLVSTTGLVEAPARPRACYLEKGLGKDAAALEARSSGAFLLRGDERTTEVLKSYMAQALMYWLIGEPFCAESGCRLYNAHWQEELLGEWLDGVRDMCDRHRLMFAGISMEG
jgi:hypothetical protein